MAGGGRGRWLVAALALAIAAALLLLLAAGERGAPSPSAGAGVERAGSAPGAASSPDGVGPGGASDAPPPGGPRSSPAADELHVVVTCDGRPCAQPLELRSVDGPEVVPIAPDAAGACRVRLTPGWWSVAVAGPYDDVGGGWTGRDPRSPTSGVTFALVRAAVLLVPWGPGPGEPPERPDAEALARPAPRDLLHLDLRGPRLLEGIVRSGPGEAGPPFPGATVDLELHDRRALPPPPPAQRVVTGADGRFRFVVAGALLRGEAGGEARVVARAPGWVAAEWAPYWDEGEEDVTLVLLPGALTLAGRVVDAAGAPAPGAIVEGVVGLGRPCPATLAGPDGRFLLEGIAPGSRGPRHAAVEVTARLGSAQATRPGLVVGPGAPDVELVLAAPAVLVVRGEAGPAGTLEAHRHTGDGRPPERLQACWPALQLECGDGEWLEVLVSSPGFVPRRVALRPPCPPAIVTLARGGASLSGRVLGADGSPAADVAVRGRWGDWTAEAARAIERPPARPGLEERPVVRVAARAVSGPDGSFALELPGPGPVLLQTSLVDARRMVVEGDGAFGPEERRVGCRPTEGQAGGAPVALTLDAPWSCRVRLRPVAAESGAHLPGARLQLACVRPAGEALEADLLRPGRHRFTLSAEGRVARELEVDVVAGAPLDLGDVGLERAGALEVTLCWPDAPIARVALGPAGEEPVESFDPVLADLGEPLLVEGLAPGPTTWLVSLRRPDGGRYEATVEAVVVAGRTTRAEVDLRAAPLLPPRGDE